MRRRNLWYKSSIVYQLDVRTFCDSNGNGWGDFRGLIDKLDYLTSLGVNCIWLKPFNTSPHRDGGYDISDYYAVDPRIGSLGDFVDFMEEASSRGINVITEIVADHTSSDHPWFREASTSVDSPLRDFYIWRKEPAPPHQSPPRIVWSDEEGDDRPVWTKADETGHYYLHRFYPHEPDLNNDHPVVREEILKLIAFWLRLGVSGFRVDAAPYMAEKAAAAPDFDDPHDYLRELRRFIVARRPDAVFMAEADVDPKELGLYFGNGDEMTLLLNFLLSEYLFLALAEGDAIPVHDLLDILPPPPPSGGYANFLRNHDELDLERLDEDDRDLVWETFAPAPEMRIYDRGIRRRVATMLGGDQAKIRLAHSLLFSMPGTPIVYYGDEIGMGDDLRLPERQSVRTPMQWEPRANGGFSTAEVEDLYLPPISDGSFSFRQVNVSHQQSDPDSLLNWMRRLINTRKEAQPVGCGEWSLVDTGDDAVLALRFDNEGDVVVVYHNLSPDSRRARLPGDGLAYLYEVFADVDYGHADLSAGEFTLRPLGFRWLRGRTRARDAGDEPAEERAKDR